MRENKFGLVLFTLVKNLAFAFIIKSSPGSKISRTVVVSLYPRPPFKILIPSTCLLLGFQSAKRTAPNPGVSALSTALTIGREL